MRNTILISSTDGNLLYRLLDTASQYNRNNEYFCCIPQEATQTQISITQIIETLAGLCDSKFASNNLVCLLWKANIETFSPLVFHLENGRKISIEPDNIILLSINEKVKYLLDSRDPDSFGRVTSFIRSY